MKDIPHGYYPRPQMKRDSFFSLNGAWRFGESEECKETITVPYPPESKLSGLGVTPTPGWTVFYKKSFTLPEKFNTGRVILHFGAVDTIAQVSLNGSVLGSHEGGYHPFFFDITELLKDENELSVKVTDDLSGRYPYGKQSKKRGGMWYTPHSGIWQSVWLEAVPVGGIESITLTQSLNRVTVKVKAGGEKRKITLTDSGETLEFCGDEITFTPSVVHNWTPEDPFLYYFTLENETDSVESYFALREISVKEINGVPRLCLNGVPYLFNGLLDQGYYGDGIVTPKDRDSFENDILLAKSLGFNTLRKHIKVEPLVFYHLCDVHGMVVFQDIVNNSDYSFFRDTALPTVGFKSRSDKRLHKNEDERRIFLREMRLTEELLNNSPCVLYYTVFNEGWGQFCADEAYAIAKSYAPDRIIDATSGWFIQTKSDVDSRHIYFKPLSAKKPHPTRPLVISEFGGYSHRVEGHLFGEKNYGYKTFNERADFEDALVKLYTDAFPLVKNAISALILTQISDVEDETNGLVTYDRQVVKVNEKRIRELMTELKKQI